MSRTGSLSALLLVVIAGLLAVGAVTAGAADQQAVDGGQSRIVSAENTSNHLALDGQTRQGYVEVNVDVAGATAVSADALHGALATRTFEQRYASASGSELRIAVVRQTVDHAEATLDRLNDAQRGLYRGYRNGTVSRETLVRRLARLETQAAHVRTLQNRIRGTVDQDVGTSLPFPLDRRLSELEADIVALPAPLCAEFTAAVTAESGPVLAYVEGSDEGLVLARTTAEDYARQATLYSAYAPAKPNQYEGAITEAYQRALDLYPWVSDNAINGPNLVERGASVYRVHADHAHGELTTYIHGGSGEVFHEIQRKELGGVPINRTVSNGTAALNLSVDLTTATGPMRVTVRESGIGPVPATVTVNGQALGTTGGDGTLWVVQPAGEFRVNATTAGGERVSVTAP